MNRKASILTEAGKIILNCLAVALSFIKIFHDVAVLPGIDENGGEIIGRFDYFYSIYDKFSRENLLPLLGVSLALTVASVTLSILTVIIKNEKKLAIASHIVFGISVGMFIINLIIAAMIWYCY